MPTPTSLSAVRAEALARRDRGDLNGARTQLEQAVEAAAMTSGEDHPEVLGTGHLLAGLHRQAGDLSAARRALEGALHAGSHRLGDEHPLLLAISFDLAEIADELGNRHEARRHYTRVATYGPLVAGMDPRKVRAAQAWLGPSAPTVLPGPTPLSPPPPAPATPGPVPAAPGDGPESVSAASRAPAPAAGERPPAHEALAGSTVENPVVVPLRQAPPSPPPPVPVQQPEQPYRPPVTDVPARRPPVTDVVPRRRTEAQAQQPYEVPPPAVLMHRPVEARRRGRGVLVGALVSALVAVIAATVTVLLLLRPETGGVTPPGVVDRGPATNLLAGERAGRVTLTWTDPSEGTAAQVVLGARPGEQMQRLGNPESGATRFPLDGLNPTWDYCFRILTIYSNEAVHQSEQACINRTPAPSKSS